jgi:xanthine dehydrogenase small subunit
MTLLDHLRATGRCGTKEGCAEGDCGACTVLLVDRTGPAPRLRATNACLTLLPQVAGQEVVTAEGLGSPAALHPVQAALATALGSQCGYCTPGFVCALAEAAHRPALRAPEAEAARRDALSGNLCRCTGYRPIVDALRAVAGSCPDDVLAAAVARPGAAGAVELPTAEGGFFAPDTLAGLWALRAAHPGARLVAGATDLGLDITQKHARPTVLIGLDRLPALRGLRVEGGAVVLGAAEPLADVEDFAAEALPELARMLRYFGSRPIKQRATLGGNLVTASPIGDTAPVFLALDATFTLVGPGGSRAVAAADFFRAYRQTALQPDEVLAAVRVPVPRPGEKRGVYKLSRRKEMDISAVSLAGWVRLDAAGGVVDARLAYGGMAATPARARAAEAVLRGQPWGPAAATAAGAALDADFSPLSDHRGSAAFRRTAARNLLLGFALETAGAADFVPLPPQHTGTVVLDGAPR